MFRLSKQIVFYSLLNCFAVSATKAGRLKSKCSEKWSLNRRSCYFIGKHPISWHRAKDKCEKKFSSLAKISSSTEHRFLSRMMRTSPHKKGNFDYSWIGLQRNQMNGQTFCKTFCWLDGSQTNFTAWKSGKPNINYGFPDGCVAQQMNTGLWHIRKCTLKFVFVCERVLPLIKRITITNTSSNSVVIAWKPGNEGGLVISYYRILLRRGPEREVLQSEATTLRLENLQHGMDYSVQVQAVGRFGNGTPSSLIVFRTDGEASTPKIKQLIAMNQIQQGATDKEIFLLCEAVGLLPLTFTWKRSGKVIKTHSKSWETSMLLKLTEIENKAMVEYACNVTNYRGTESKTITLRNLAHSETNQAPDHVVQDEIKLHQAVWLSLMFILVVALGIITALMRCRLRSRNKTKSNHRKTRHESIMPSIDNSTNVSREDNNESSVPVYMSPGLRSQTQMGTSEIKYNYAYDHRVEARKRLYSIANHTYVNDSEVSFNQLESGKATQRFVFLRPIRKFVKVRHQYVNYEKSLPELKGLSGHQIMANSRLAPQLGRSVSAAETPQYINCFEITNEPLKSGELLNNPVSESGSCCASHTKIHVSEEK